MPYRLLLLVLFVGCAELPEDASTSEDSLEEAPPTLALESCPQGRCRATRAKPGLVEITNKRNSLSAELRELYFQAAAGDVATTPDGAADYQWFGGLGGRGAIYNVHADAAPVGASSGTFYIYGAIFEAWVQGGYEHGLGYFEDPLHYSSEAHQLFEQSEYIPSIANGGLQRSRGLIIARADGSVTTTTRNEYLNSSNPGTPALSPQRCEISLAHAVDYRPKIYPEVALDGYTGQTCGADCFYFLWCGATPPPENVFVPDV